MKYLLLLMLIFSLAGCGEDYIFVKKLPTQVKDIKKHYTKPSELTIDTATIKQEIPLGAISNQSTSFIKDLTSVTFKHNASHYFRLASFLIKLTFISDLKVKMESGKLVQATAQVPAHMTTSFSSFLAQVFDLKSGALISEQIHDNFFNSDSFLPTKDGEYWSIVNFDSNSFYSLFKKMKVKTAGCSYFKKICSEPTGDNAIVIISPLLNILRSPGSFSGTYSRLKVKGADFYLLSRNGTNLSIRKQKLSGAVLTQSTFPLHSNGSDIISKIYFHENDFYIGGYWHNQQDSKFEIMKFGTDLTEKPEIAFDNLTSGPDYNIEVINSDDTDQSYAMLLKHFNSIGDDILLIGNEYSLKDNQRLYDTYIFDNTNGKIAHYFNGGKAKQREFKKNEFFYNDNNHIYFLNIENNTLKIDAINKGGVPSLINGALEIQMDLSEKYTSPKIHYFDIKDGTASLVIFDQGKTFLKRFNIH